MAEFGIIPCSICGKTPTINKNIEVEGEERYRLSHCDLIANGSTETLCIVNWNKLQDEVKKDE